MIKKIDLVKKIIIPSIKDGYGKVLKTCIKCRMAKVKCDAIKTQPYSCSNCQKKNLQCQLDLIIKKSNRSNNELLKKLKHDIMIIKVQVDNMVIKRDKLINSLVDDIDIIEEVIPLIPNQQINLQPVENAYFVCQTNKLIESFQISIDQAYILIKNYENYFNSFLPIFPDDFFNTINFLTFIKENELLFWCIMLVSLLNDPLPNSHIKYQHLSQHIQSLVVEKCWLSTPRSGYTISALLILTTWPLPNNNVKTSNNLSIKYISMIKSLSLQFGLHKLQFIHEFSHGTSIDLTNEINLNNLIRERIYKFTSINSNFWLISLGLSNNNYNGFTHDYIINKASIDIGKPIHKPDTIKHDDEESKSVTKVDILNRDSNDEETFNKSNTIKSDSIEKSKSKSVTPENPNPSDLFINSLLKISIIQSKLNENMNDYISNANGVSLLPNQVNTSQMINLNMFEIILNDLNLDKNPLIQFQIEFSKLQVYIYGLAPHDITIEEYKVFIKKILVSCFNILYYLESMDFLSLPIYYKFPVELVATILLRMYKSPVLNSVKDYEIIKTKFNKLIDLFNEPNWKFMNVKLMTILTKFDFINNSFIISKSNSIFLINKMKNYLVSSLTYEMIWFIYESERDNNHDESSLEANLKHLDVNDEVVKFLIKNESIFEQ